MEAEFPALSARRLLVNAEPLEALPVVPRHPASRLRIELPGMALQSGEVIEGVGDAREDTSLDQTHKKISHPGAHFGFIEQRIAPVEDGFF